MANKERVQLLVDALRSGKFTQGRMVLRIDQAYCCLGVACEIYRQETGAGSWQDARQYAKSFVVAGEESVTQLPDPVANWYGFGDQNPRLQEFNSAIFANDDGRSFRLIADDFEETYINRD